ncbi:MAG: DUF255 domain-containing protein [Planctomycetes bacterium]|nr:DUF255 domain-containing protein [Planctomycetota bacterium]
MPSMTVVRRVVHRARRVFGSCFTAAAICLAALGLSMGMAGCVKEPDVDLQADGPKPGPKDWSEHTHGLPFIVGMDEGLATARAKEMPAMLFVTTTWCGWCKKLAGDTFKDPTIRQLLTENFICVLIDGDAEKKARTVLGARAYPHVIFHDRDGERVLDFRGYIPKDEFQRIVEEALAKSRPKSDAG